ncbi:NUDIX domain-containing protein [Candidatus Kaiserbacteria bacterium]|nr:NUDIX domain-containing protein [Candidatus Kaiserbacteria bacterium]
MEVRQDNSVGIIPVHTGSDGARLFCLVHHAAGLRHAEAGSGLAEAGPASPDASRGGHWAFPKGHIDAGESREAAARRELYEEAGILTCKIDTGHIFIERYSFEKDRIRYDKEVTYFLGFVETKKPVAPKEAFKGEIVEARWVSYYEAKEILTFPEAKKLLEEVCLYLQAPRQGT